MNEDKKRKDQAKRDGVDDGRGYECFHRKSIVKWVQNLNGVNIRDYEWDTLDEIKYAVASAKLGESPMDCAQRTKRMRLRAEFLQRTLEKSVQAISVVGLLLFTVLVVTDSWKQTFKVVAFMLLSWAFVRVLFHMFNMFNPTRADKGEYPDCARREKFIGYNRKEAIDYAKSEFGETAFILRVDREDLANRTFFNVTAAPLAD